MSDKLTALIPRKRPIDPGFWQSERLGSCSFEARLLFLGLTMVCDKEGRMPCRPDKIQKAINFPSNCQMERALSELESVAMVKIYEIEGNSLALEVVGWTDFHTVYSREKTFQLPAPPEDIGSQTNLFSPTSASSISYNIVSYNISSIPVNLIVGHLNRVGGRRYKENSSNTAVLIKARWLELDGTDEERLEIFYHVHEVKWAGWAGTNMERFYRPETLYNKTKFEGYVNERMPRANLPERVVDNIAAAKAWIGDSDDRGAKEGLCGEVARIGRDVAEETHPNSD